MLLPAAAASSMSFPQIRKNLSTATGIVEMWELALPAPITVDVHAVLAKRTIKATL